MGAVRPPKILVLTIDDALSAQGTEYASFSQWLVRPGSERFNDADADHSGALDVRELSAAWWEWQQETGQARSAAVEEAAQQLAEARPEQNPRPAVCDAHS